MVPSWIIAAGMIVVVLGAAYGVRNQLNDATNGIGLGLGPKPTIWWVVDDSQVNSRQWLDWSARSTREPNEPYLKICLRRARQMAGEAFQLESIVGRVDAHARLEAAGCRIPPDADRAPPALWLAWARAAFLNHLGGLWLDGSVLPIGNTTELSRRLSADVLTFGTDPEEGLSVAESTAPAAGPSAGWAAKKHHPMWAGLQRDHEALIDAGDQSWSSAECRRSARYAWDRHAAGITRIDRAAEVSRDQYGRRLEIDTLLGETEWIGSTKDGLWVPLPDGRDKLERSTPWLWFLRLSETQIRDAKFLWSKWASTPI